MTACSCLQKSTGPDSLEQTGSGPDSQDTAGTDCRPCSRPGCNSQLADKVPPAPSGRAICCLSVKQPPCPGAAYHQATSREPPPAAAAAVQRQGSIMVVRPRRTAQPASKDAAKKSDVNCNAAANRGPPHGVHHCVAQPYVQLHDSLPGRQPALLVTAKPCWLQPKSI